MTQLWWALFTPHRGFFFLRKKWKRTQFRNWTISPVVSHTQSDNRSALMSNYLTLLCVPRAAFRSGDNLAHGGESVVACCVCLCLTDLPRHWEPRIPPHLWSPAISQPGSEEFLCNSHACPVFSKHGDSSPRVCLRGWPISVGSVKLFLL